MKRYRHVSNHVHGSGVHCRVHASPASGCAFVHFIDYNSKVSLFQAQDVWKQVQSSGDAPGTGKKCQLVHYYTFQVTV